MSFGNLFIELPNVGGIELDASISEEHDFDTNITTNPTEEGVEHADNIVLLPIKLSMTARVSDASMIPFVPSFGSKSIDAYNALIELQTSKQLVDITTGIRTYENMYLKRISIPRTLADGNSIRFEMEFQELLIVGDNTENNRELISEDVIHTVFPENNAGVTQKVLI